MSRKQACMSYWLGSILEWVVGRVVGWVSRFSGAVLAVLAAQVLVALSLLPAAAQAADFRDPSDQQFLVWPNIPVIRASDFDEYADSISIHYQPDSMEERNIRLEASYLGLFKDLMGKIKSDVHNAYLKSDFIIPGKKTQNNIKIIEGKPQKIKHIFFGEIEVTPVEFFTENNAIDHFYELGNKKYCKRDYAGALANFNKVIKLKPEYAFAYTNRSAVKVGLKDYKGALEDSSKGIELDSKDVYAYFNRALSKSKLKDYIGAIADYTKAIENNSDFSVAYYNRGKVYLLIGDKKMAKRSFSKAKHLGETIPQDLLDQCK